MSSEIEKNFTLNVHVKRGINNLISNIKLFFTLTLRMMMRKYDAPFFLKMHGVSEIQVCILKSKYIYIYIYIVVHKY